MTDHSLHVDLPGHAYPIHIGAGKLAQAGAVLGPLVGDGPVLIVADQTVADHYGETLRTALENGARKVALTSFPAGETSKQLSTAERLWQACAEHRLDRSGTIVALGGGVSGDLAGFVAACWMRGLRFVQVPTTLLAMVDSSVGGKTGVNSAAGKNLIGAFHQPAAVLIDPLLLQTMDQRAFAAGLAEVLKYGIINDADFLTWQETHAHELVDRDAERLAEAVHRCCAIKAWYVANDEREHGVRAHLNYGHTFGHALERDTHYERYLHGEAVAIGMRMAAQLARSIGLLSGAELADRQDALLAAYGLPMLHDDPQADAERLAAHCGLDKKVRAGRTRFVLPSAIGSVESIENPEPEAVIAAFRACMG